MSTFVSNNVSSGAIIYASDHNEMGSRIAAVVNGGLDDNNISSLSGTKVVAGTLPGSALDSNLAGGWITGLGAPDTVTYNGNRSYSVVYNGADKTGTVSNGMRLKLTRSVSAPTQCTSLNGSTQYFSKSSPAGMTFTDDFVVSAWIKLSSYPTGTNGGTIASRYSGSNGWIFRIKTTGQVQIGGVNSSATTGYSITESYQSIPLNKWVHIVAQLDMSSFTASTTTSYIMIDGVDVPASVSRGSGNPTALVQAGNLEIGSENGGTNPLPGKVAQMAIFNAKVTQATMRGYMSQSLTGTETNLISAYSFNNTVNDLNTTNANNLTAQGSAVATNVDAPWTQDDTGTPSGTTDFGIITSKSYSGGSTTLTVQVPEGCTIPTSGGVSAVSYSTQKAPFGFPAAKGKWRLAAILRTSNATTSNSSYGSYLNGGYKLTVPADNWRVGQRSGSYYFPANVDMYFSVSPTALTGLSAAQGGSLRCLTVRADSGSAGVVPADVSDDYVLTTATDFVMYTLGASTSAGIDGKTNISEIYAECAYL